MKAGIDWIAESKDEEREILLKQMPYLPFAVLVDRTSFEKIKNGKIKIDFVSDYPVPIVNVETIQRVNDSSKEDIFYFCSFSSLILDKNQYEQYIEGIEAKINSISREIASGEIRLVELNIDLVKVAAFLVNYPKDRLEKATASIIEINLEIETFQSRQTQMKKDKNQILKEKESVEKQKEELTKLIANFKDKADKLGDSIKIKVEQTCLREELSIKRKGLESIRNDIKNNKDESVKIEIQYKSVQDEIDDFKIKLHDLGKELKLLSSFEDITDDTRIEDVRAQYKALYDAVNGKTSNESKLRSDVEEYKINLNKLKERIMRDYRGDLEQIEISEENGVKLIIPSQESIGKAISDKEIIGVKLEELNEKIKKISLRISSADGKLGGILEGLAVEIKADLPQYETEDRYNDEIQYTVQLIKSYEEEIIKLKIELDRIKVDFDKLSNQAEYYDNFIEREIVLKDGAISSEVKEFRSFEKEYLDSKKTIENMKNRWFERIKIINEESTTFIIRDPLEELAKISQPETAERCQVRKEDFKEYIINIEEQMQKISSDIEQLESYQQDFTRRCIQRAEFVLGHLRKLESLSRIEVYGRRTNMIELKLQEFEEKEKHLRMRSHIDSIVKEISENGIIDRKRVATKLSTKELLAQITDMDKAVVKLFKIESIPENSKPYKWEKAIGSDGQNNSLYFIFAACLISFIRMLSITNTSYKTKKVIIADNPFGATSAVYLWDPMFKIMKQNNIQLIAPGHRIPREITSKFGVSYLLNQDILQDGRMRVVVKDVRVEEDEDLMRYIEPEQFSLFDD